MDWRLRNRKSKGKGKVWRVSMEIVEGRKEKKVSKDTRHINRIPVRRVLR